MTRLLSSNFGGSTKYLRFTLLYFVYIPTLFYFGTARPTGSKLLCTDGCKHIRLTLGTDNHLTPRWALLLARDASEEALLVEVESRSTPIENLEVKPKGHPGPCYEAPDRFNHKPLAFGIENHLIPMQTTIRRSSQPGEVLSLNAENPLAPFKNGAHVEAGEILFPSTGGKIHPIPHLARRNFIGQEPPPCSGSHTKQKWDGVGDVAEELLVHDTESHIVRCNERELNPEYQIHVLGIESNLIQRSRIPVGRTDQSRYFDNSNRQMSQGNEVQDKVISLGVGNQPIMIRRAEPENSAVVESDIEQENQKSESTVVLTQSMAGPQLPPIMPSGNDIVVGNIKNHPAHRPLNNNTAMFRVSHTRSIKIPSFTWFSIAQPTLLAKETLPPQETLHGGSMATFNNDLNTDFEYPPDVRCFSCVLRVAIGFSVLLAMTSLFLLCCLSRKGQYIWINTVNIVGPQNSIDKTNHGLHHDGSGSGTGEGLDGISSEQGVEEAVSRHGTEGVDSSGIASRQNVQSPNRLAFPGEWITPESDGEHTNGLVMTPRQKPPRKNRSSLLQGWLNPDSHQTDILKKPGVFQRLFGPKIEKHVNFKDVPLRSPKNGRKIHSIRARNRERSPDPSILLTKVTERLMGERMRQLSTILSVSEEEDAQSTIVNPGEGEETSSMSSVRAVATGSTMGTQRRDNTIRRNRPGVLKTFNDMNGVAASLPISTVEDGTNTHKTIQREEFVGDDGSDHESKGKSVRSVRFDESADKTEARSKEPFGRASIKQYLFPTVEDDRSSMEETPCLENTATNIDSGTIERKERPKEKNSDAWENISQEKPNNSNAPLSANSRTFGVTCMELGRQPKSGIEIEECGNSGSSKKGGSGGSGEYGSSIGDESTLTVGSNENSEPVLVDHQPPIEGERRPEPREPAATSGFAMGSDLALNHTIRRGFGTIVMDEVVSDECGVSAFGLRAKSPRWDSQTSNGDSELEDCEISSGYFTGSSNDDVNIEHDPGNAPFIRPVGHIRKVERVDIEIDIPSALNCQVVRE